MAIEQPPREPAHLRAVPNSAGDARVARTPAEVLRRVARDPVVHVATGIAPLDAATGGGPRPGDFCVVQGAPDDCKTLIAACLADAFASSGALVGAHLIDEPPEKFATRLAQRRGAARSDVEARTDLEHVLHKLPDVAMFDESVSAEHVIAELATRSTDDRVTVLIVDSLQWWVPLRAVSKADAVAQSVALLRSAAARGWIVVATSEAGRSTYGRSRGDQVPALAAGKWSSDIEFQAKLLIALERDARDENLLLVSLVKNKLGARAKFQLRIDRDRQTVTENQGPRPEGKTAEKSSRAEDDSAANRERLFGIVAANPGIGTRAFRKLSGLSIPKHDKLVTELELAKRIENKPDVKEKTEWPRWFAAQSTNGTSGEGATP